VSRAHVRAQAGAEVALHVFGGVARNPEVDGLGTDLTTLGRE
jgi:hypothetical protein